MLPMRFLRCDSIKFSFCFYTCNCVDKTFLQVKIGQNWAAIDPLTENKRSSTWQLYHPRWHRKLSSRQLMVPPGTTKLPNWRPFVFSAAISTGSISARWRHIMSWLWQGSSAERADNLAYKFPNHHGLVYPTFIQSLQLRYTEYAYLITGYPTSHLELN